MHFSHSFPTNPTTNRQFRNWKSKEAQFPLNRPQLDSNFAPLVRSERPFDIRRWLMLASWWWSDRPLRNGRVAQPKNRSVGGTNWLLCKLVVFVGLIGRQCCVCTKVSVGWFSILMIQLESVVQVLRLEKT